MLIQDRHSGYIQVLPCNTKHLTSERAAKWTASQWISNWDVPSEILTDSRKDFIRTWWENMCALLGVHHLRAQVYDHRALPAERAGRILINILRKFLATEKDYNWLETIYCVLRRYHRTKNYTGLSPNELVFGREKMVPEPVMYHPRQCYDASKWFERIKDLESKWIQAKVKTQADWLKFKNQLRTQGKPFEKGQQIWLCKSDETLKDDNKLLPLWEGPFQVSGQLGETTFNIAVEPGRHQEVRRDRLKAKVPCPKGKFKPLYWTSKYLSDRKMVTSSFELEKILDYKKIARMELRKGEKTSFRKQKHVELPEMILFFPRRIELGCVDGGSPQSFFLDSLQVHSNPLRWCVRSLYLLFSSFSGALLIAWAVRKAFHVSLLIIQNC